MIIKSMYLALFFLSTTLMVTVVCGEETGMVLIPAGEFNTGETKRIIYLDKFYIDKTEVT